MYIMYKHLVCILYKWKYSRVENFPVLFKMKILQFLFSRFTIRYVLLVVTVNNLPVFIFPSGSIRENLGN